MSINNSNTIMHNQLVIKEENKWTQEMVQILDNMRINCSNLSEYYIYRYQRNKHTLTYFRIPIILFSGMNVFIAVGLQSYLNQTNISIINSIVSLVCGLLTSIELFLNIQKKMESDFSSHKDFYRLSIDIYKIISLNESDRKVDGKTFLDQKYSEYEKLIESSNIVNNDFIFDTLSCQIPIVNNNLPKDLTAQMMREYYIYSDRDNMLINKCFNYFLPCYKICSSNPMRNKIKMRQIQTMQSHIEKYNFKTVTRYKNNNKRGNFFNFSLFNRRNNEDNAQTIIQEIPTNIVVTEPNITLINSNSNSENASIVEENNESEITEDDDIEEKIHY
jgi:hypothetical protein